MNLVNTDSKKKVRVCVIGSGAAGLCALRHLSSDLDYFEPEAFEQTGNIGGIWIYTEKIGLDENGFPIHTSMYRDLRSNAPCELMNFPDFRTMKGNKGSGVHREILLSYLRDYANHFQILHFIKFFKKIEEVRAEIIQSGDKNITIWHVKIKDLNTMEIVCKEYDAIMVCTGNYSRPNIPIVSGIENFPGQILHSHTYRKPEEFIGKNILIFGSAFSATDIGVELSTYANVIYMSNRGERITSKLPPSIIQVPNIKCVEGNKIYFIDGSSVIVDVFMYCTGYLMEFPFLDKSCAISVDDNFVYPLYKHTININQPTMCFLGINSYVITFPMFHVKALFFLYMLKKRFKLPSKEIMLEDAKLKGNKKRHAHRLFLSQYDLFDSLAHEAGFQPIPHIFRKALDLWTIVREDDLWHYKDYKIIINNDDSDAEIVYSP
ncbi:flavin-containing monooxygenase FMO GS-OX-like 2 [Leptopilina heterotoma]|uniref:flavin-containing monooxygenase FMO GS-OX-like 2 n=1 Tax=Leptopilina heterotoma TaxID=63436 RepID=UPI001CA7EE4A|nr:flavin-containing monooxygenase FMO GS-OX-like 2 [Leptopilina heterotoma]